jgi:adenine-specific DNA-methyltransferase
MAKKAQNRKPAGKTDVETYKHKEAKRKNIPTAENQKLIADDDKAVKKLRWPRNPDLDPQLVWRGKDTEPDPLEVDAPPIYIQEKIKPQAIIEDLRRQTKERSKDAAPQFDFFHDFNGLPEGWKEDATASYYHDEGNWSNRMILGDSLLVMASLAEREGLRGKVQCIYMDPPYGIRFNSNWQPSTKSRKVEDTKTDSISREPEVIRAFRDTWKDEIHSYLNYLKDRLIASRDLLTDSGSIFLQIGLENLHIVHALMDEVFGAKNLISVITFQKTGGQSSELLASVSDYLIWFAKNIDTIKYRQPYRKKELGVGHGSGARYDQMDDQGRAFQLTSLTSNRPPGSFPVKFEGEEFVPSGGYWKTGEVGFRRLIKADRVQQAGRTLRYQRFLEDFPAYEITNSWLDTAGSPGKIYVVQTSPAVIARCVLMTTDPGDLVFDPTCGSGTTAYVAEQWGRRWITIDTSRVALTLSRARLMSAQYDYYLLRDSKDGAEKEGSLTGKPPTDGQFASNIRHGFVYERAPHVQLKTIANDFEIDVIWERWQTTLEPLREKLNTSLKQKWEEWEIPREADEKWPDTVKQIHAQWWKARRTRQKEIDDSIARNAEVEYLYDRPYKARGVVRVAGPFTVESLSPHRVLPMGEDPYLEEILGSGEDLTSPRARGEVGARSASGEGAFPLPERAERPSHPDPLPASGEREKGGPVITDFAQVVYDNLYAAGVQNTKKGETLKFEWLKPFASRSGLIQFEGRYQEKGASKRAAVCIGPEYDTVGYDLVRQAAREAADLFDTLIVCGFAFAPEVDDTRLNFGALTVLKARMNQDLRMADKLKATGAGNLFVVFGEPDIVIHKLKDDMLKVEIKGMDIFDPTTGEVRSSGGKELMNDVAAWFIDNDYDEDSFFVRQAYFVGDDPYDGLKRALKAEIDETAWAELNSTVSRPFPRPTHGRICVKVINHFGDEVQKVFQV